LRAYTTFALAEIGGTWLQGAWRLPQNTKQVAYKSNKSRK
jgi:hypothetical protein